MNAEERAKPLKVLQGPFEKNMQRHKGVARNAVASRLEGNAGAPKSLAAIVARMYSSPVRLEFERRAPVVSRTLQPTSAFRAAIGAPSVRYCRSRPSERRCLCARG